MRGMNILIGPLDWQTTNLLGVPHYVILTEKFCFLTACHVCAEIPRHVRIWGSVVIIIASLVTKVIPART